LGRTQVSLGVHSYLLGFFKLTGDYYRQAPYCEHEGEAESIQYSFIIMYHKIWPSGYVT